jgi:hypothetical protein
MHFSPFDDDFATSGPVHRHHHVLKLRGLGRRLSARLYWLHWLLHWLLLLAGRVDLSRIMKRQNHKITPHPQRPQPRPRPRETSNTATNTNTNRKTQKAKKTNHKRKQPQPQPHLVILAQLFALWAVSIPVLGLACTGALFVKHNNQKLVAGIS